MECAFASIRSEKCFPIGTLSILYSSHGKYNIKVKKPQNDSYVVINLFNCPIATWGRNVISLTDWEISLGVMLINYSLVHVELMASVQSKRPGLVLTTFYHRLFSKIQVKVFFCWHNFILFLLPFLIVLIFQDKWRLRSFTKRCHDSKQFRCIQCAMRYVRYCIGPKLINKIKICKMGWRKFSSWIVCLFFYKPN